MASSPRSRRSRLTWTVLVAVAIVGAAAVAFAVLRTEELPREWSGKAEFCRTAEQFSIGNLGHGEVEPVALLKSLRQHAPQELFGDLDSLIKVASAPPTGEDPVKPASQRVGTFIETRCGVNLPGVVA